MTPNQWNVLLEAVAGRANVPPAAFIADSPWLPGWCGHSIMDYYADDQVWLECNLAAIRRFPGAIFLPGFWAEYGMCTEPSAFGAPCVWQEHELPFAGPILREPEEIVHLRQPDPRHDGLLPFVLRRLVRMRPAIEREGHVLRFAVARGPLNIASFLMGATEFLMATKTHPEEMNRLLDRITDFLADWLRLQKEAVPTLEGIFILDDLVGFLSAADVRSLALPRLKRLFSAFDARIRFFHNDAHGLACAPCLAEAGVNLFNFSHEHGLSDMRARAGASVALLGNLPPRDVLAAGTPEQVREGVRAMVRDAGGARGLVLSCGGGLPPGVPTANLEAFLDEAQARPAG